MKIQATVLLLVATVSAWVSVDSLKMIQKTHD